MSSLTFSTPSGYATDLSNASGYSAAVRIPPNKTQIKIAGQGGWDPTTGTIPDPSTADNLVAQVHQAFENVDQVLRHAGSKNGWGDVFLLRLYIVDLAGHDGLVLTAAVEELKKRAPQRPVATAVEVKSLAFEAMRIEVEVEAVESS